MASSLWARATSRATRGGRPIGSFAPVMGKAGSVRLRRMGSLYSKVIAGPPEKCHSKLVTAPRPCHCHLRIRRFRPALALGRQDREGTPASRGPEDGGHVALQAFLHD